MLAQRRNQKSLRAARKALRALSLKATFYGHYHLPPPFTAPLYFLLNSVGMETMLCAATTSRFGGIFWVGIETFGVKYISCTVLHQFW